MYNPYLQAISSVLLPLRARLLDARTPAKSQPASSSRCINVAVTFVVGGRIETGIVSFVGVTGTVCTGIGRVVVADEVGWSDGTVANAPQPDSSTESNKTSEYFIHEFPFLT